MRYSFLILSIVALSGCSQLLPQPIVLDEATQETAPEVPAVMETQETEALPEEPIVEGIEYRFEEILEDNEEEHYSLEVRYPQFLAPGDANVSKVNEYIAERFQDSADFFAQEVATFAIVDDSLFAEGLGSYYVVESSVEFLADQQVVAVTFFEQQYMAGAAHPNSGYSTMNFDLTTGELITLGDLFMGEYLLALRDLSADLLTEQLGDDAENAWIFEGVAPYTENFENFVVTDSSLVIYFNPYTVAPYVFGPLTVEIPYSDLEEFIDASGPLRYLGFST